MGIRTSSQSAPNFIVIDSQSKMNALAEALADNPTVGRHCPTYQQQVDFALRRHPADRPPSGLGRIESAVACASDMHLAAGVESLAGKTKQLNLQLIARSEDVTPDKDASFRRAFEQLWEAASRGTSVLTSVAAHGAALRAAGEPYFVEVIDNGDGLELLQIPELGPQWPLPDGIDPKSGSPARTPANELAKLSAIVAGHPSRFDTIAAHLARGHSYTVVVGNHDSSLANLHVWDGDVLVRANRGHPTGYEVIDLASLTAAERARQIALGGQHYQGYRGIIRNILEQRFGLSGEPLDQAIGRFQRAPMRFVANGKNLNVYVHGNQFDEANVGARPYEQFVRPADLREPLGTCFGTTFVQYGLAGAEDEVPTLDGIQRFATLLRIFLQPFRKRLWLRQPARALAMVKVRLQVFRAASIALRENGYITSPEDDVQERRQDLHALVARFPQLLEDANRNRSARGEPAMSAHELAEALHRVHEGAGAVSLQQSFVVTEGVLKRMLVRLVSTTSAKSPRLGKLMRATPLAAFQRPWDTRSTRERMRHGAAALHRELGATSLTVGHTHVPEVVTMLTPDLTLVQLVNTHTSVPVEAWASPDAARKITWSRDSVGLELTEAGRDAQTGEAYVAKHLARLERGILHDGSELAAERLTDKARADLMEQMNEYVRDFVRRQREVAVRGGADAAHLALPMQALLRGAYDDLRAAGLTELDISRKGIRQQLARASAEHPEHASAVDLLNAYTDRFGASALRTMLGDALVESQEVGEVTR